MGHHHEQTVPRGAVIGAAVLMLASIAIAAFARSSQAEADARVAPPVAEVMLRFADRADGAVLVHRADTGEEVAVLQPESEGFVRGVLRGLFRARRLESIDRDAPFRLAREVDGRFTLSDPSTGRSVELRSFGQTNYESFARLLAQGSAP